MLKVFYKIIILVTIPLSLASQNVVNQADPYGFGEMIINYSKKISFLLNNNLSNDYIVRFIAHFDHEYAFQIKKTDSSNYEISTIAFRENIWNANNLDSVAKNINRRNISEKIVLEIDTLFNVFIDSLSLIGVPINDDTTYHLIRKSNNTIKFTAIKSHKKTQALLIEICELLMKYAEDTSIEEIEIQKKIDTLKLTLRITP